MSVYRMGLVWQFSRASGSLLLLLLAIADYADDEGVAFPALETLARKVRKGERQTRTLIREAEAIGELEVYQQAMPLRTGGGLQRTNVYVLTGEGGRRASSPFEKGGQSSVEGGAVATAPEPLEEPLAPRELVLRSRSSRSNGDGVRKGDVAEVVRAYRGMPGARPTAQDGGTLAGLVGRYGKEAVLRRIEDLSPELAAAREPLLYLAGSFRRPGPPAEAVTLAERKEELRKQMARTHGGIWGKP